MYCELFLLFLRVVACQTVRLFEDITANRSLPQSVSVHWQMLSCTLYFMLTIFLPLQCWKWKRV